MTTTDRTWTDMSHRERAAQHRANAAALDGQGMCRDSRYASIDPVREAARERRAAEAEDVLAAEEAAAA